MRLKDMKVSSLLKGGIYEVSFGYDSKTEGYTTLMSDIPELSEIARSPFDKGSEVI
jgi:hypothetical protein